MFSPISYKESGVGNTSGQIEIEVLFLMQPIINFIALMTFFFEQKY